MQIDGRQIQRLAVFQRVRRHLQMLRRRTRQAHVAFAGQGQLAGHARAPGQLLPQRVHPLSRGGADMQCPRQIKGRAAIRLVAQDQARIAFRLAQQFLILGRQGLRSIQHQQHQIGRAHDLPRALHADGLHCFSLLTNARGIAQVDAQSSYQNAAAHHIARGAGDIGHDGALLAKQGVEQRAFAHIGPAAQRGLKACIQQARRALIAGGQQRIPQRPRPGNHAACGLGLLNFLRIVQRRGDPGQQIGQALLRIADKSACTTVQLPQRRARRLFALRADYIHHSLGAAQIHATVQEGTAGKLPRLGRARAQAIQRRQRFAGNLIAAMQMKLRHILARIGARSQHQHSHALVQHRAVRIIQMPIKQAMGFHLLPARRAKERFKIRASVFSAHAHNGDAAAPRWGSQRRNGIVLICQHAASAYKSP